MVIARQIAARDPASATAQFDLSAGLAKLGNAYLALNRTDEALASFREALENARQLAAADPDNSELQRSLSVLQSKVGGAQLLAGHAEEAAQSFQAAIEVAERLVESDPDNVQSQRDRGRGLAPSHAGSSADGQSRGLARSEPTCHRRDSNASSRPRQAIPHPCRT